MNIDHVSTDALNRCHVAVVNRFPTRRFRIWDRTGFARVFDAATTLKWLERNANHRRYLSVLS